MRAFTNNFFSSLPVQLFILHFRKYQVLLVFWYVIFSTVASVFLKYFGGDSLFFSPEYLGRVNFTGFFITGCAFGIFIMSWNITTFILHSRRLKFLATTSNPFLKYSINNSILPICFLIYYFNRLWHFNSVEELLPTGEIIVQITGVLAGIAVIVFISFIYFFGAQKRIRRYVAPAVSSRAEMRKLFTDQKHPDENMLRARWYFDTFFRIKRCRNVAHYRRDFLEMIFRRYHWAAILSIVLAFLGLVTVGFLLDYDLFEIPAAASALIVFALLIALIGALVNFLQSWSLPAVILIFIGLNLLYKAGLIDPRNKAYGLDYSKPELRPEYNRHSLSALCSPAQIRSDRDSMLKVLNNWKKNQAEEKPLMVFINVSGGGLRSAAFTMNALQQADSICGGKLMQKTFLISGASGGMLAATYYRELYRNKLRGSTINLAERKYTDNIAKDLLNPVFTSLMARDLFAPVQKFERAGRSYLKDRGYAFEKKLSKNTGGLLDISMRDLQADEHAAKVPLIFFNTTVKSDARKLIISTLPVSYMMKPREMQEDTTAGVDAVDFGAMFRNKDPLSMGLLSALRMNASFPYVLPNVWLPSTPVIDVMDAGLRDNFGGETTLRFIDNFREWLEENTSGIMILEIRDRTADNWHRPFETNSVTDMIVTPATMLQHNWFKIQDYSNADKISYFKRTVTVPIYNAHLMYIPAKEDKGAALNFHLSAAEKKDVILSLKGPQNAGTLLEIKKLISSR